MHDHDAEQIHGVQLPLPAELIAEIFELCLPDNFDSARAGPDFYPMCLTHVCSSWRRLAQNTPSLWTMLRLSRHDFPSRPFDSVVEELWITQLLYWLGNSKNLPISLSIRFPRTRNYDSLLRPVVAYLRPTRWTKLMDVISTNAHRFRYLDFFGYGLLEEISPLKVASSAPFTSLEVLRCELHDAHHGPSSRTTPWEPLGNAPNLRKLLLDAPHPSFCLSWFGKVSWESITHVSFRAELTHPDVYELLSKARALQECELAIGDHFEEASEVEIDLPHLRRFDLQFAKGSSFEFFRNVNLPSLKKFALRQSVEHSDWSTINTIGLGRQHLFSQFGDLESLTIGYIPFTANDLLDLLRTTPKITELELDCNIRDYDTFLENFQDHTLLPTLTKFGLYVDTLPGPDLPPGGPLKFSPALLAELVRTRPTIQSSLYVLNRGQPNQQRDIRLEDIHKAFEGSGLGKEQWPKVRVDVQGAMALAWLGQAPLAY
ncbi:hypothetical protein CC1G_02802 [Coprinopsis cinerea okayama7|uniref:Uncharacterized protein n=1 Tax=Coprinopsis cinerea (strain Okayama-7 / 130 / ATCC MYA-4618 / FGSC 9003) TaxID=240176 RepID=A8N033_COPC7|nr:hypothetical protein CC1G_02802 [Coprinopsis cinerea okayama7\|eukprot:XP_001828221.1 hypothetical protein CC1G_02802 [Coprinopsis cinerea okayama7\